MLEATIAWWCVENSFKTKIKTSQNFAFILKEFFIFFLVVVSKAVKTLTTTLIASLVWLPSLDNATQTHLWLQVTAEWCYQQQDHSLIHSQSISSMLLRQLPTPPTTVSLHHHWCCNCPPTFWLAFCNETEGGVVEQQQMHGVPQKRENIVW